MQYKIKIKALSPIHIGTGDQISPFEFVIKDSIFYRIDLPSFLSGMPESLRSKFETAVNNSNIIYMRKFIAENIDLEKYTIFRCDISKDAEEAYYKKIKDPNNQLLINMFVRSGIDKRPVVPGSSIKGALRTAIVNTANNAVAENGPKPPEFPKNWDSRWESVSLKYGRKQGNRYSFNLRKDPFRSVSVSDVFLKDVSTIIDKAVMIDKACNRKAEKIDQTYEQTFSIFDDEEITGEGTLTVDDKLQKKSGMLGITADSIAKTCRDFYLSRMKDEHEKFYRKDEELKEYSSELLEQKYGDLEFPVRLGRFSHCECVTVDPPYRNIKTPRNMPYGTTRTLAGGFFPFGWAKIMLKKVR